MIALVAGAPGRRGLPVFAGSFGARRPLYWVQPNGTHQGPERKEITLSIEPRPFSAEHPSSYPLPPRAPFDVVIVGPGRVGSSFAAALERAGHRILARIGRADDPGAIANANVVVIAVPDDALAETAAVVARLAHPGTVVMHTCGLQGLPPLADCGPLIAAVHPAASIPATQPLDGVLFGVTCDEELRAWCESFVRDLGGVARFITDRERVAYHAALVMAANYMVTLAGDSADLLGGHEYLIPLLRRTLDNIETHGPDHALTGPVVRGDAGTVRAHLEALPEHLREVYVANARRAIERSLASGRLDAAGAQRVREALEEATQR